MAEYSIKELEKLSGIKAHTIRIWEKRYKLVSPKRTSTNIRYYSDNDLKKIINVALVNNSGVKISHIARLGDSELNKLVHKQTESAEQIVSPIDRLAIATVEMDERIFSKTLKKLEATMTFEEIVIKVFYPFLEKIGVLWQTGEIAPAQEHFISNLIRQKLFVAIDNLPLPAEGSPKVVLFLPENEFHEIGLLFSHYIARKTGCQSYYLGQSVPYGDLIKVVKEHNPKFMITSFVTSLNESTLKDDIRSLSKDFRRQSILISGGLARNLSLSALKNVQYFASVSELKALL